jgi:hypothetical protein
MLATRGLRLISGHIDALLNASLAAAMLGALPSGDQEYRAATNTIAQKHGSHHPILVVYERVGHC